MAQTTPEDVGNTHYKIALQAIPLGNSSVLLHIQKLIINL